MIGYPNTAVGRRGRVGMLSAGLPVTGATRQVLPSPVRDGDLRLRRRYHCLAVGLRHSGVWRYCSTGFRGAECAHGLAHNSS
jgi:hypothetical protein